MTELRQHQLARWPWILVLAVSLGLAASKASSLWERYSASFGNSQVEASLAHVPIEKIQLGDRVPGENPIEDPDTRFGQEIEPASWRRVDLRCPKKDGSVADVSLLRPALWLFDQGAEIGGILHISVPECGIDGNAEVLSIDSCPQVRGKVGNVVTGTFRHRNATVIDVFVDGQAEPIGTTQNHKFWSADRRAFVRADGLRVGEAVTTLNGSVSRVSAVSGPRGPVDVYNIETYPWHTYHVSGAGLLVHNANPAPVGTPVYHGTTTLETVTTDRPRQGQAKAITEAAGEFDAVDRDGFSLTRDRAVAEQYARTKSVLYGGDPVVIETTLERLAERGVRTIENVPGKTDAGEIKIPWKETRKIQPGDFTRTCP